MDHRRARRQLRVVARLLDRAYGRPRLTRLSDPLDELVGTILSQNTSDTNSDRAYTRLREVFPTWEAVLAAPRSRIAATIRPGGLANIKTRRIKAALRWVRAQRGRLDLRFLRRLPLDEGRRVLEGLRGAGIGPKTAACVLLFACGKEAFPVDTHIHRVGKRLGLLGPRVTREQAHAVFETLISPGEAYPLHLNLIRHGRQVCHARRPHCQRCVLLRHCPYGQRYGDR